MSGIVGIRFKEIGKVYYFDSGSQKFAVNDLAVVETAQGLNCGRVVIVKSLSMWSTLLMVAKFCFILLQMDA